MDLGPEGFQAFRHDGIQHEHRGGRIHGSTQGAEFEPVAGKGERRSTVAVGVVRHDFRNGADHGNRIDGSSFFPGRFRMQDAVENLGQG